MPRATDALPGQRGFPPKVILRTGTGVRLGASRAMKRPKANGAVGCTRQSGSKLLSRVLSRCNLTPRRPDVRLYGVAGYVIILTHRFDQREGA